MNTNRLNDATEGRTPLSVVFHRRVSIHRHATPRHSVHSVNQWTPVRLARVVFRPDVDFPNAGQPRQGRARKG